MHKILALASLVALLNACGESAVSERSPRREAALTQPSPRPAPSQPPPGPVAPSDPSQQWTKGSGGPLGLSTESFTDDGGMTSRYKINAAADSSPTKAYGLLVYLHGDGGGEFSWFVDDAVRIARKYELIPILVLSPNNGSAWYNNGVRHARFLDKLLQSHIYTRYNIDKRRVYFGGASGGSQFLTGQFVPVYGANYQGGSVQMCGGAANWGRTKNISADMQKNFKLYFYTQSLDFLYDQVLEGVEYYKNAGLQVIANLPSGGKHCGFNLRPVLDNALQELGASTY